MALPHQVAAVVGEPERAQRVPRDLACPRLSAACVARAVDRHYPAGGDLADRAVAVGEPECSFGAGGDSGGVVDSGAGVVDNGSAGGDAADGVVAGVGEPEGSVGAGGDPVRAADPGAGVMRDLAGDGDAADGVVAGVGEPKGSVGPGGDPVRAADPGAGVVGQRQAG